MKFWEIRINWLFGVDYFSVKVKANTKLKAEKFAKEKVKKEKGDHFFEIANIKEITKEEYLK